jgi:prepilin-type processing-associated H-X9-DG protein
VLLAEGLGSYNYTTGCDYADHTTCHGVSVDAGDGVGDAPDKNHDQINYPGGRVRHNGGSEYAFFDGHVKYFHEPAAPAAGAPPTEAQSGIIYSQDDATANGWTNVAGWWLETGYQFKAPSTSSLPPIAGG